MPHFFASNLRAVALPARTKNFEFIFEAKSLRDESAIIFAKSLAKSLHGGQKILLSKQKKGARFLVKFNKHFSAHSKEIIKSALKEYAELVGAEIVAHNLSENKIRVDSAYLLDWRGICALLGGNSVLGMQFRTCENFGESTDSSLVLSPKFSQIQKPHRNHFDGCFASLANPADCDSLCESTANQTKIAESSTQNAESSADSAISQNLNQNNGARSAHLESRPLRGAKNREQGCSSATADFLLEADKRGSPPKSEKRQLLGTRFKKVGGSGAEGAALLRKESSEIDGEENAESSADSANPAPSTQEANSSIFDEKSGLCSCERENRTKGSLTKRATNLPDLSHPTGCEALAEAKKDEEFAMLEIGFGSGRHILHLAQKHPTAKIIGLEIYRPAISQVLRQIEILGLQNLYVASLDARVLCEVLPAKCLDRIYLHFPVPWDKNPQRRVLSAQFLGNAMRALKDDGFFELLTDSAEYFAFAKELAKGYKFKAEEGAEGEVVSKYEARWRRQEKVIYKLCIYPACGNSPLDLHSADFANLGHCTDFSLALRPKFAKNHESQTENHSVVDSARSAESGKNNSVRSTQTRPLRGAKNRIQASSSASADFLLEADKRGSPPKSEKRQLLARRGSGVGGAALLREEKNSNENAESSLDSVSSAILSKNGLPRRFCESTRNDDSFLDSANLSPFSPTKICKKEYFLHIKNKYIFEGGVVLFASFGAYYAPSSAYFVICGNEVSTISEIIPTRANIDALGLFMELCFDN